MKRPKSALIMNIPPCFLEKQNAVNVKLKFKECFGILKSNQYQQTQSNQSRLIDKGPSLFDSRFTTYNRGKSFKGNKMFKPSKRLNRTSIRLLRDKIKDSNKQTNIINIMVNINKSSSLLYKDIEKIMIIRSRQNNKKKMSSLYNSTIR